MRRVLNSETSLYFDTYFPHKSRKTVKFKHYALIGVGGNLGDVRKRFKKLFLWLQNSPLVQIISTSPILKNPPFGFAEQSPFFNAVIELNTNLNPKKLLNFLLSVEERFGRVRTFKNAPRTLDLDIVFYDNLVYKDDILEVPHPKWQERESVLIPLSYIQKANLK